jgi:hypothetical protein
VPPTTRVFSFYQWENQRPRDLPSLCAGMLSRVTLALSGDRLPRTSEAGSALSSLCLSVCHGSSARSPDRATIAFVAATVGQFLPPYVVIGSFPINGMKLLLFVISFALESCSVT